MLTMAMLTMVMLTMAMLTMAILTMAMLATYRAMRCPCWWYYPSMHLPTARRQKSPLHRQTGGQADNKQTPPPGRHTAHVAERREPLCAWRIYIYIREGDLFAGNAPAAQ